MSIRVLVIDDSAMMRALISRKLNDEPDIEVIAAASDAAEARQLIRQFDPDVVTLDIEMPGMDGLSFLGKIMSLRPTPVIIVSGSTRAGTQATARALQLGAVNCYAKSTRERSIRDDDGGELARLVREASKVKMPKARPPSRQHASASHGAPSLGTTSRYAPQQSNIVSPEGTKRPPPRPDVIAIGSSTGGVEALHTLLAEFPADCPPTMIVQHVNATFSPAIAQSLDTVAQPKVELAASDTMLQAGHVYLAPGEIKHLEVARAGSRGLRCVLRDGDLETGHRPSVDRLFGSVAKVVGQNALGILLTGIGEDGARSLLAMAQAGAYTIAQDQASCVVFGMPRAAIALGAAQSILPLDKIAHELFPAAEKVTLSELRDHLRKIA
jgi:two-component system, chemotaxis family, protein-glutamate methylesterase/glutaminase